MFRYAAVALLLHFAPATGADEKVKPVREFTVGKHHVTDLAFMPDGKELVCVCTQDGDPKERVRGPIRFVDPATGKELRKWALPDGHGATLLAVSPDGKWLASATRYIEPKQPADLLLWDVAKGEVKHTLKGHRDNLHALHFSPNSKRLVSSAGDRVLRVWDTATGACTELKYESGPFEFPGTPAFLDDDRVAVGSVGGYRLTLWSVRDKKVMSQHGPNRGNSTDSWTQTAVRSDGKAVAVTGYGGKVALWEKGALAKDGLVTFAAHEHGSVLKFQPDSKLLAVGYESKVRLWDTATRRLVAELELAGLPQPPSLAFSPDGKLLACGSIFGKVQVFDVSAYRVPLGK